MGFDYAMGRFPCCLVHRTPTDKILVLYKFIGVIGITLWGSIIEVCLVVAFEPVSSSMADHKIAFSFPNSLVCLVFTSILFFVCGHNWVRSVEVALRWIHRSGARADPQCFDILGHPSELAVGAHPQPLSYSPQFV